MATMMDTERRLLVETMNTEDLLDAIAALDLLCEELKNGSSGRPPQLRDDLMNLLRLMRAVVNHGARDEAPELFKLASELEVRIEGVLGPLEQLRHVLFQVTQGQRKNLNAAGPPSQEK